MPSKKDTSKFQTTTVRSLRLGIAFTIIFALSTLIYKAWKLLTPDILQQRFFIAIGLILIHMVLLVMANKSTNNFRTYKIILWAQTISFLALAGYAIYSKRGMASNAVVLFLIPIIISSLQRRGKTLFITTTLAATVYSASAITYFRHFPSEGYKVELYGGLLFYCAVFFVIAALLWVLIKSKDW